MRSRRAAVVLGGWCALQLAFACGGRSADDEHGGTGGAQGAAAGRGGQAGGVGRVTLKDAVVYANCTPGVTGDPILASWTAVVSEATGRNTAKLTSATLRVVGPSTVTQELVVEPTSVGLTDGSGTAEQRKVDADTRPPGMLCVTHCQSTTWTLDVEFDVGRATATGDFTCPS